MGTLTVRARFLIVMVGTLAVAGGAGGAPATRLASDSDPRLLRLEPDLESADKQVVSRALSTITELRIVAPVAYLLGVAERVDDPSINGLVAQLLGKSESLDRAAGDWLLEHLAKDDVVTAPVVDAIVNHRELHERALPLLLQLASPSPSDRSHSHSPWNDVTWAIEEIGVSAPEQIDAVLAFKGDSYTPAPRLEHVPTALLPVLESRIETLLPQLSERDVRTSAILDAIVAAPLASVQLRKPLQSLEKRLAFYDSNRARVAIALALSSPSSEAWRSIESVLNGCGVRRDDSVRGIQLGDFTEQGRRPTHVVEYIAIASIAARDPTIKKQLFDVARLPRATTHACLRAGVYEVIAELGGPEAFELFSQRLATDPSVTWYLERYADELRRSPKVLVDALAHKESVDATLRLVARIGNVPGVAPTIATLLQSSDGRTRLLALAAYVHSSGYDEAIVMPALRDIYDVDGDARGASTQFSDAGQFMLQALAVAARPSWATAPAYPRVVRSLLGLIELGDPGGAFDGSPLRTAAANLSFSVRALTPPEALSLLARGFATPSDRDEFRSLVKTLTWHDPTMVEAADWLDGELHVLPSTLAHDRAEHLLSLFTTVVRDAPEGKMREAAAAYLTALGRYGVWSSHDVAVLKAALAALRESKQPAGDLDRLVERFNTHWYESPVFQTAAACFILVILTIVVLTVFGTGRQVIALGVSIAGIAVQGLVAKLSTFQLFVNTPWLAVSYVVVVMGLAIAGVSFASTLRATIVGAPWTRHILGLTFVRKRAIRIAEDWDDRPGFLDDEFVELPVEIDDEPRPQPVAVLEAAITKGKSVVITGVGGVGKTTLAHAVMHAVRSKHPDWLVVGIDVTAIPKSSTALDLISEQLARPVRDKQVLGALLETGPVLLLVEAAGEIVLPEDVASLARTNGDLRILAVGRTESVTIGDALVKVECLPVDETVAKTLERSWNGAELAETRRRFANVARSGDTAAYLPFLLWLMCKVGDRDEMTTVSEVFDAYLGCLDTESRLAVASKFTDVFFFARDARRPIIGYDPNNPDQAVKAAIAAGVLRTHKVEAATYVGCIHDSVLAHIVASELRRIVMRDVDVDRIVAIALELAGTRELIDRADPGGRSGGELYRAFVERIQPWTVSRTGTRRELARILATVNRSPVLAAYDTCSPEDMADLFAILATVIADGERTTVNHVYQRLSRPVAAERAE